MGVSGSHLSCNRGRCSSADGNSNHIIVGLDDRASGSSTKLVTNVLKYDRDAYKPVHEGQGILHANASGLVKCFSSENMQFPSKNTVSEYADGIWGEIYHNEEINKSNHICSANSELETWFANEEVDLKANMNNPTLSPNIDLSIKLDEAHLSDTSSSTSSFISVKGVLRNYKKNLEKREDPATKSAELLSDGQNGSNFDEKFGDINLKKPEDGEINIDQKAVSSEDNLRSKPEIKCAKRCKMLGFKTLTNGEAVFTAYMKLADEDISTWDQLCKKSCRFIKGLHNQFNCEIKLFEKPIRHRATIVHKICIHGPNYRDVLRCKNALPAYISKTLITSEERRDGMLSYQFHRR